MAVVVAPHEICATLSPNPAPLLYLSAVNQEFSKQSIVINAINPVPTTQEMGQVKSLIRRAQSLARLRHRRVVSAESAPCQICQKITLYLPMGNERQFKSDEVEQVVLALVGAPCPRIEQWIQSALYIRDRVFAAPANVTLFNVNPAEAEAEHMSKMAIQWCNRCSRFGYFYTGAPYSSYLAVRHTWDSTWQFDWSSISSLKDNNGREIGSTLSFKPVEPEKQGFLAIVNNGEVASSICLEKILI